MSGVAYPVHVDARMDRRLSRWLWLVKWLLVIPHLVVLIFLWIAFVVLSIVAFFAILATGRYPRSLFEFNVGVLRWTWRVTFYAYGSLGSDRYPPFTLADVPDYPAHFTVEYPTRLSRGLVLVKWWLLAIPHYLVVGVFVGGAWAIGNGIDDVARPPGLIGLLVAIAGVTLLFTGQYPQQIFDFVVGMNRWALRVAAYAGLMTDEYPPFRMDLGGREPAAPAATPVGADSPAVAVPERAGWATGRVVSVVAGSVVGLLALGILSAGGVAVWATTTQRDTAGYLTTESRSIDTSSYAITSDDIHLGGPVGWLAPARLLGTIRVRATSVNPKVPVFVGIGPTERIDQYLGNVPHLLVNGWGIGDAGLAGGNAAPIAAPDAIDVWAAHVSGPGTKALFWPAASGSWVLAVMNANGQPGVAVQADVGVTLPALNGIAVVLVAVGVVLAVTAIALVAIPVARASRSPGPNSPIS